MKAGTYVIAPAEYVVKVALEEAAKSEHAYARDGAADGSWMPHDWVLKAVRRSALETSAGLQAEVTQLQAEIARLQALSVTNIMLAIVPGLDGMGHEVFAKSVKDVEDVLSKMGEQIEDFELGIKTATKDQFVADQVAEHMQAQQTSMVRATVAAVMEAAGLTTLTINMDRQGTIWDRVEMFTDRDDEQTHVTFTLTPR